MGRATLPRTSFVRSMRAESTISKNLLAWCARLGLIPMKFSIRVQMHEHHPQVECKMLLPYGAFPKRLHQLFRIWTDVSVRTVWRFLHRAFARVPTYGIPSEDWHRAVASMSCLCIVHLP